MVLDYFSQPLLYSNGLCTVGKKILNHLKPFSLTMQPLAQDILDKEKIVEKYAGMATMERIKGLFSTAVRPHHHMEQRLMEL